MNFFKKKLLIIKKNNSGRSNGKISVRHIGKKHKRFYRKIDFLRNKLNIPAIVDRFEYDPNRNSIIALLKYLDGEYRYIIKTNGMEVGSIVINTKLNKNFVSGDCTIIKNIFIGTSINCIRLLPNYYATIARSSGVESKLLFKDDKFAIIKLPSQKEKKISVNCFATIGKVDNNIKNKLYKAGQKRWKGIRPTVRGVAMNPVDHPLGGGEGKTSGGRHPCSPFGKKSKGFKTKK
ncbi:50S ribosomal protein L2 [Candidatus Carsonella ruddii]|uniref:Large ribosomal subunit protein uL2 n=1 Tax=Carsonella ruddii TaxID=114186 RepID=A0AAE7G4B0_CARRU|nr:50S ribosomal protein L2 [Candidatus Carsonella ruddii]AGS06669.1 50S ribosomal protein L2 [Candidatus Carsonella ruddii DC]ALA96900.1 50S ribosomal protein L2 [Candidatus Carsonella ruddii]QLK14142.1 50S ribosomal protein L2 [Candidatus Carsonella ruddii]